VSVDRVDLQFGAIFSGWEAHLFCVAAPLFAKHACCKKDEKRNVIKEIKVSIADTCS
jgi:hypothetical protein